MKRLNHLVLGSITVLASIGLAGLFIFPASGEGEQHYDCRQNDAGDEYNCTLVEDASASYTHTCVYGEEWTRCTGESGEENLNFCLGINSLTCEKGYTKTESIGGYYFIEDFGGDSHCVSPSVFNDLSTQGESMITCDYYGAQVIHYNSCKEDGDGIFCQAKYVPKQDEGVRIFSENPVVESDYYYCEVTVGPESIYLYTDSKCYLPNQNVEAGVDCFYDYEDGKFICPIEHSCIAGPGGEYCREYDSEQDEEGGYYCADNGYFFQEDESSTNNNNSCISKNGRENFKNCEYRYDSYFCPVDYECLFDEDDNGHYCEPKDSGDYSCRIIYTEGAQAPEIGDEPNSLEAAQGVGRMSIVCTDGEDTITSCQFNEDYPEDYTKLFCPVEVKYDCRNEDGLAVVCNPSTTGNFSCDLPIAPDKASVNYIHYGYAVCSDGTTSMNNCYYENGLDDGDYVFAMDHEGYYVCPIKYNCDKFEEGMHVCSPAAQGATGYDYFYCDSSNFGGGGGLLRAASMGDYRCEQPEGTKKYNECDYHSDGKLYCMATYDCSPVDGGHQCNLNVNGNGNYQCTMKDLGAKVVTDELSYECSGEGYTYDCSQISGNGYFCPEIEYVSIKLYVGGCISDTSPTSAAVTTEYYCDGNGYLGSVTVIKNSGVDVATLAAEANLSAPDAGNQWVWYLDNNRNQKLTSDKRFDSDSKLYVFQDAKAIGTITFNSNGGTDVPSVTGYYDTTVQLPSPNRTGYNFAGWYDGNNKVSMSYTIVGDKILTAHWTENKPSGGYSGGGGSSSRPSSKGSGPSTSDVKSVENKPNTPAKEVKAEPKPVVPGKGANYTGKVNSNQELFDAYKWAYDNGLTKYANMSDARMDDLLNRQEMAKISTIFATKFQGETPNEKKRNDCSQYPDLWKTTKDMQEFIIQSCELGYMGYRANGVDYLERFRPYTPVSVAEVSIILSRIMWQNKYAISENLWYQGHLHAVYENNLLDNITKPFDYIARKDAYIMLYRISKTL